MPSELTRRSVLRTTAWSVPVLALAVAVPAASASGEPAAILNGVCVATPNTLAFRISATAAGIPAGIQINFVSSTVDLTTLTAPASLTPISVTAGFASYTYGFALSTLPAPINFTGTLPTSAFNISGAVINFGGDTASLSFNPATSFCVAA
ncbi:MAG: hypothetical protein ABJB03_06950 [Rhodoglobus sp.]